MVGHFRSLRSYPWAIAAFLLVGREASARDALAPNCQVVVAHDLEACTAAAAFCDRFVAGTRVTARFEAVSGGVRGELTAEDGTTSTFERTLAGRDCEEVAEALALAYELHARVDAPAEPTLTLAEDPEPVAKQSRASELAALEEADGTASPTSRARTATPYPALLGLGGIVSAGDLPQVGVGLLGRLRSPSLGRWAAALELEQRWDVGALESSARGLSFSVTSLGLALAHGGALVPGWWLSGEAGPSFSLTHLQDGSSAWNFATWGLTAGATTAISLLPRLVLEVRAGARLALVRNRLVEGGAVIWAEPWLSGSAAVLLGWTLE
jgi:hypothetical protein